MKQTVNDILEQIAQTGSIYDEIIDNILTSNKDLKGCLLSEIYLYILENQDKVQDVIDKKYFKYWFVRVIQNQVKSSTSPFYTNCRQTTNHKFGTDAFQMELYDEADTGLDEALYKEELFAALEQARTEVLTTWFDSEVFRFYYDDDMTYRAIEAEYGIDHCLAYVSVKKSRNMLKKRAHKILNKNK